MKEYMTVKETAEKWNISERQVQILCKSEKIVGVERVGRNWIIPKDSKKPKDGRIKSNKYINWRSAKRQER